MDNKAKILSKILKTTHSEISISNLMIFKNNSDVFSHRTHNQSTSTHIIKGSRSQIFSKCKGTQKMMEKKKIKQQNIRLLSKLIQIKQKKSKFAQSTPKFIRKSRQNPERIREIQQQNKRLGKSIFLIRTGKTIERAKTQINEKIQSMLRKQRVKEQKSDYNLFFQERKSLNQLEESKIKEKLNDRYLKSQYI